MRRLLGSLLLAASFVLGAIPIDTVWEVRTTGSDLNGGGFSTASKGATGVDMTYGAGYAIVSFTSTLSGVGTTALTDSAAGFVNTMLGNTINIVGQGVYCITGYTSTSIVTVDRNLGTFSTTSGKVGGALATPGFAAGVKAAGNTVYIAAGTYVLSSASPNVAGGIIADTAVGTAANPNIWEGYQSARGDLGAQPMIQIPAAGVDTVTIFSVTGNWSAIRNIKVDGQSKTAITGIAMGANVMGYRLTAIGTTVKGIAASGTAGAASLVRCSVSGFSGTAGIDYGMALLVASEAHGGSCTGITNGGVSGSRPPVRCLSYANSGGSSYGFYIYRGQAINCVAYGNGSHGFYAYNTCGDRFINCLSEGNGGYGFAANVSSAVTLLLNCGDYNNTSGATSNFPTIIGHVTGTATFFTNAGAGNFALNTTAGGGAAARAAGYPGLFLDGTTTGYMDIGAAQHADPASSGGQKACTFISRLGEKGWTVDEHREHHYQPPVWAAVLSLLSIPGGVILACRARRG